MGIDPVIIIQARLASSRLPEKVLKNLHDIPVLSLIIKRLEREFSRDQICISTSTDSSDDRLLDFAKSESIHASRGELDNIVGRLLNAAKQLDKKTIVRVWGDSPFICADTIKAALEKMEAGKMDYISTFLDSKTYPAGMDFEIYSTSILESILSENNEFFLEFPFEWVQKNNELVKGELRSDEDNSFLTMTLDYPDDLERLTIFYKKYAEQINEWDYQTLVAHAKENQELFASDLPRNIEYKEKRKNL